MGELRLRFTEKHVGDYLGNNRQDWPKYKSNPKEPGIYGILWAIIQRQPPVSAGNPRFRSMKESGGLPDWIKENEHLFQNKES